VGVVLFYNVLFYHIFIENSIDFKINYNQIRLDNIFDKVYNNDNGRLGRKSTMIANNCCHLTPIIENATKGCTFFCI
jgi:hypothetical protein